MVLRLILYFLKDWLNRLQSRKTLTIETWHLAKELRRERLQNPKSREFVLCTSCETVINTFVLWFIWVHFTNIYVFCLTSWLFSARDNLSTFIIKVYNLRIFEIRLGRSITRVENRDIVAQTQAWVLYTLLQRKFCH